MGQRKIESPMGIVENCRKRIKFNSTRNPQRANAMYKQKSKLYFVSSIRFSKQKSLHSSKTKGPV